MPGLFPAAVASLCGSLVLVLTYGYLYACERKRFLAIWTVCWGVYAVRFVIMLFIKEGVPSPLFTIGYQATALASGLLLLWGACEFVRQPFRRWWWALFGATLVWVLVAGAQRIPDHLVATPVFGLLALVYVYTGIAFLRLTDFPPGSRRIVGWSFVVWGIHKADYPLLRSVEWFVPWWYLLGAAFGLTVAIGILLLYFEKTRGDLRVSEARYGSFLEHFRGIAFQERLDGTLVFMHGNVEAITGYTERAFMAGRPGWEDIVLEEDRAEAKADDGASAAGLRTEREYRIVRKDGQVRWIYELVQRVCDESGQPMWVQGARYDETDRKRAEEALEADEADLEALLELNQMTLAPLQEITDFALEEAVELTKSTIGYLAFMNEEETVFTMHSWSKEVMEQCAIADTQLVYSVDQGGLLGEAIRQRKPVITNDYAAPSPLKRGYPEGHVAIRRHMSVPVFDGKRIVVVVGVGNKASEYDELDARQVMLLMQGMWRIIQRKRAAEDLRESRERYRDMVETIEDWIWEVDAEAVYTYVSPRVRDMLGYEPEELLGTVSFDLIAPEEGGRVADHFRAMAAGREPFTALEAACRHKDGHVVFVESSGVPILGAGDTLLGYRGVNRDITERRRAQKALRQERDLAQNYLNIAGVILIVINADQTVALVNRKGCEILECGEEDIVGKNWFGTFLPERNEERTRSAFRMLMAGELEAVEHFENPILTATGKERIIEWHNTALRDESGEIIGTLSSGLDVTERRRAEEERQKLEAQVQQTQKLESLGVLAGGIAHDFNNLLMAILGNAGLVLDELSPGSPVWECVEEIDAAAKRAADLCRQMLAYSGKGRFQVVALNLNDIIEEMAHLLAVSISKKVVLQRRLGPNLPAVEGDATQIRQVIMNLITNASEAIGDEGGVVSISTGIMTCDRAYLEETYLDEVLQEGGYVYVEVSDTGRGMDGATRAKIFDPFFTTKFAGRGLGLAAVLGIVRGHKGGLKVYSEPGKGTTFKVLFPCLSCPAEPVQKAPVSVEDWHGSGTILLVDDEERVRRVGRRMLAKAGFTVLTAADGREAVDVFRQHADEIVCVLLDLTMPHMDGEETFRELRRMRATVPVILSSGYNEQDVTQRFVGKGLAGFIEKPYQVQSLLAKLGEVLPRSEG